MHSTGVAFEPEAEYLPGQLGHGHRPLGAGRRARRTLPGGRRHGHRLQNNGGSRGRRHGRHGRKRRDKRHGLRPLHRHGRARRRGHLHRSRHHRRHGRGRHRHRRTRCGRVSPAACGVLRRSRRPGDERPLGGLAPRRILRLVEDEGVVRADMVPDVHLRQLTSRHLADHLLQHHAGEAHRVVMPRPALLGHDLVGPEVPPEKVRRLVVELGETTLAEDVQPRSFPVEQPDLLSYVHNSLFLGSCTAFHRNLPPGGA